MMKNKIELKKYLKITVLLALFFIISFSIISYVEYQVYTRNFNNKIAALIDVVKENYPDASELALVKTLNNKDGNKDILKRYGINFLEDNLVLENKTISNIFIGINSVFVLIVILILSTVFLKYNKHKDNELAKITKYIEEINKKNYSLHIDEISEDELSILKNEIYKTTVMLKEQAENSLKDKLDLKDSLSNISHQLKTPLTSILIMLDNIIDNPDMPISTREEFISDIKKQIVNINFLVQSILKLSRLDSNTVNFVNSNILISALIEESVKKVSSLCDLKNIKINVSCENNLRIKCDFHWQIEALTNIIKNAVEHSYEGTCVDISAKDNKSYFLVEIKDYGKGIAKEDLPHIFERFYKGKDASSESIGIGLALSKSIIESAGGNISVESFKKGTTFRIKYYKV